MTKITINNITFDPERHRPALAQARLTAPDSANSDYVLVQGRAPLSGEQQAELENAGARILEYVPEQTYLCRYTPADLTPIRSLPFVAWANVYMEELKLKPALRHGEQGQVALLAMPPTPESQQTDSVTVDVVMHDGVDPASLRTQVAAAAGVDPATVEAGRRKLRLTAQRRRLSQIAAVDGVRHIEEYIPATFLNAVARRIMGIEPQRRSTPLIGTDQIIAICDSGLDTGDLATLHPAFENRVIKIYPMGGNNRPKGDDPNGHGTHVAGSAIGNGTSSQLGKVQGGAPGAKLVFQSVLNSAGKPSFPLDLHDLFQPPYDNEAARIHSNSWGHPAQGDYTTSATEVDDFVWNHRDLFICCCAGNSGSDSTGSGQISLGSLASPGTAKNCLTIGASENFRPGFLYGGNAPAKRWGDVSATRFPAEPIKSGRVANSPNGVAPFSSRGPATAGRIKPDVVAPGTAILSVKSSLSPVPEWGPSADSQYVYMGGTSQATPLVAGSAAVLREWLTTNYTGTLHEPRPASVMKALLVNLAMPIKGQFAPPETGPAPDMAQGFGRVTLDPLWGDDTWQPVVVSDEDATLAATDDEKTWSLPPGGATFPVPPGGICLKTTLVWTDPPGQALQNDLDLIVKAIDAHGQMVEERHGNIAAGLTDFDRVNNVEQVYWPRFPGVSATVTVKAHRIMPGKPQSYALVVRLEPNYPLVPKRPSITPYWNSNKQTAAVLREDGTVDGWPDVSDVIAISGDGPGMLALRSNGTIAAKGFEGQGQPRSAMANAIDVQTIEGFCFAINRDGTVISWLGRFHDAAPPNVSLWQNVAQIVVFYEGFLLLKRDGTLEAWTRGDSPVIPVTKFEKWPVSFPYSNIVSIKEFPYIYRGFAALLGDGSVITFNFTGLIDKLEYDPHLANKTRPPDIRDVVAIATGAAHVVALRRDGTVAAWGTNNSNQCDVPDHLTNVVAIAASMFMSHALRSDGSVVSWGSDAGP